MTESNKLLDPVCDMIVDIAAARDQGLTMEMADREYAFCGHGCLVKFAKAPQTYIPKVDAWLAAHAKNAHSGAQAAHTATHTHPHELPPIDNGMREWYKSCRCCMSDAHPRIVEQLDAEKARAEVG